MQTLFRFRAALAAIGLLTLPAMAQAASSFATTPGQDAPSSIATTASQVSVIQHYISADEIRGCFRIDPHMLGLSVGDDAHSPDNRNFSLARQQEKILATRHLLGYTFGMAPMRNKRLDALISAGVIRRVTAKRVDSGWFATKTMAYSFYYLPNDPVAADNIPGRAGALNQIKPIETTSDPDQYAGYKPYYGTYVDLEYVGSICPARFQVGRIIGQSGSAGLPYVYFTISARLKADLKKPFGSRVQGAEYGRIQLQRVEDGWLAVPGTLTIVGPVKAKSLAVGVLDDSAWAVKDAQRAGAAARSTR